MSFMMKILFFNLLLVHMTLSAPLASTTTATEASTSTSDDINQSSLSSSTSTAVSGTTEISHATTKQNVDNTKEINDKTGTFNKINSNKINNYDNETAEANEIKDEKYEKTTVAVENVSPRVPLIIFETQNKSDPDSYIDVISDKDTTIEITLTSDDETPAGAAPAPSSDDYESQILSSMYTTRLPPAPASLLGLSNNEDEIKIKTTDKDSDTVFLISNTEVKMMESNPTPFPPMNLNNNEGPNFNPISSIEDVVIDFAYNKSFSNPMSIEPDIVLSSLNTYENEYTRETMPLIRAVDSGFQETINFQDTEPQYVNRLVKDGSLHINTPTNLTVPSNLTRDAENELVLKNLTVPYEQFGGNTTIFLDADANSIFSGLDDFQTVVVACLLTLIPLILLAILAIAIRCIWQKYRRDYDTGSVLLGEYNSECHQNAKPNESITVDIQKNNAVTAQDDTTTNTTNSKPNSIITTNNTQQTVVTDDSNKCPNNCTSRNGSIIKMTMQNNHLIVETEERNDISRDARETKLTYTSPDKDGIFIVAATRGADQLESLKTNNILKAKQDEKCEFHEKCASADVAAKEEVQIHSQPDLIQRVASPKLIAQTGLTQSDQSLSSDSNQNYSYGTQVAYNETTARRFTRPLQHQPLTNGYGGTTSQLNGHVSSNNNEDVAPIATSEVTSDEEKCNNNESTSNKQQVTDATPPPPLPDVVV
ncbi:uncharacterized protein LOC134834973 [Culicoides brevitarsis]|uniref:uncharacterized protein LOC134834973 n=1 Tax=Culicoides brevitarsis TaxID=469753 RepID=UPI00307C9362